MNIFIIHAHTANRGDEAAIKSMCDELLDSDPTLNIKISLNSTTRYPNMSEKVIQIDRMPIPREWKSKVDFIIMYLSKGKIAITRHGKKFLKCIKEADIVLHAPGGPSIGDVYYKDELLYLMRLSIVRDIGTLYMFYAPSMGPFSSGKRDKLRKKVISGAKKVILRDPISVMYLKKYMTDIDVEMAFDSALQHDVDEQKNSNKLKKYLKLNHFLSTHKKNIGVTITDLKWHPKYSKTVIKEKIHSVFNFFVDERIKEGYGIIFIPQLYGEGNDYILMSEFLRNEDTFIISDSIDEYDTYFQQYIIGKLYCVVGMRYHSNIFSAKMGIPFISIAYEQKMTGFMKRLELQDYCLDIESIDEVSLDNKWKYLKDTYSEYKEKLVGLHMVMKNDSRKTTDAVLNILKEKSINE